MKSSIKRVHDLSADEFRSCSRLTMGEGGRMQATFRSLKKGERDGWQALIDTDYQENDAWAFMVWEGKQLLGWCLSFEGRLCRYAYFYVRKTHRRKGVGSKLAKAVEQRFPKAVINPWNSEARAFFETTNLPQS